MAAVPTKWRPRPQNGGNETKWRRCLQNGGHAHRMAGMAAKWRQCLQNGGHVHRIAGMAKKKKKAAVPSKCRPCPQNAGNEKNGGGAFRIAAGATNGSGVQESVEKLGQNGEMGKELAKNNKILGGNWGKKQENWNKEGKIVKNGEKILAKWGRIGKRGKNWVDWE